LSAMIDVFNVFNSQGIHEYHSFDLWSENYGVGSWMLLPRRAQIGIKLTF
jgi:hypothetical protein